MKENEEFITRLFDAQVFRKKDDAKVCADGLMKWIKIGSHRRMGFYQFVRFHEFGDYSIDTLSNEIVSNVEIFMGNVTKYLSRNSFSEELIAKKTDGQMETLPVLEPVNRSSEFNSYKEQIRDSVIYEYLFKSRSHRWIDANIIGLDSDESRGYQTMGILHHIGLKNEHKGLFQDYSLEAAINVLEMQSSEFSLVLESLKRFQGIESTIASFNEQIKEDIDSELAEEDQYDKEGAVKEYFGKRYERSIENRRKAIELHGFSCVVCDFNFEETYGERGKDFIEVHHVKPLSTIKGEVEVNPVTDLVPVCSNCHRMIHRKKDQVLTIDELKGILNL
ncbi:HNH endonuclease [Metabacillus sp. KUDC1714]|uniref:HNH endonuclease n=2 Tax=Metabacillus elymi TaxID=2745198 RepID=A0ABX6SA82_9BACI|nr:HNH endonuclease [Metabacillus sp. KUDC1714]